MSILWWLTANEYWIWWCKDDSFHQKTMKCEKACYDYKNQERDELAGSIQAHFQNAHFQDFSKIKNIIVICSIKGIKLNRLERFLLIQRHQSSKSQRYVNEQKTYPWRTHRSNTIQIGRKSSKARTNMISTFFHMKKNYMSCTRH